VVSDNRPTRYVEDDVVVYRASGVGGCIRSMVAAAHGHKPQPHPEWFQEVLDEGNEAEPQIIAATQDWKRTGAPRGLTVDGSQAEMELLIGVIDGKTVIIRGHMDGVGSVPGVPEPRYVVEAKKFRPSTWGAASTKGAFYTDYYAWQMSIYMLGTGKFGLWVAGEWDKETRTIGRVQCHEYLEPPVPLAVIKQRVAKVERLINEGWGPDEVECSGNYPCPFWYLHDAKEQGDWVLDTDEARDLLAQWVELDGFLKSEKAIVAELEAQKKELAHKLRELIEKQWPDHDVDKFTVPGVPGLDQTISDVTVTWVRSHVPEKTTKAYDLNYFKVGVKKSKTTTKGGK
jgi:hypothetical protein